MEYEQDVLSSKCKDVIRRINMLELRMQNKVLKKELKILTKSLQRSSANNSVSHKNATATFDEKSADKKNLANLNSMRHTLRHLQKAYDSDATESGNEENIFEAIETNPIDGTAEQRMTILHKELISCRTSVNWLNVMCKEIEIKHQSSDSIRRFCRNARGSIVFGGEDPVTQRLVPNLVQTTNQNHQQCNGEEVEDIIVENGKEHSETEQVNEHLVSDSDTQAIETISSQTIPVEEPAIEEAVSCMRTMPYRGMKRRRVVDGPLTLSVFKKVTLSQQYERSSVRCLCSSLKKGISSCLLCRGESFSPPLLNTEQMSFDERLKLLKPSYHSVMSLPNCHPAGFYFAEMLASDNFQYKLASARNQIKKKKSHSSQNVSTSDSGALSEKPPKKYLPSGTPQRPKKGKKEKINKNASVSGSMAINTDVKKRPRASFDSRNESPPQSPVTSETNSVESSTPANVSKRGRRSECLDPYDINNVVIPFDMTMISKIEKLQYKEIITPAWVYREDYSIPLLCHAKAAEYLGLEECENLSEELLMQSHSKAEQAERARLRPFPGKS